VSLLGARFSLSVVIAEGKHNSDRATGKSHTADISGKTRSNEYNFFCLKGLVSMITETKNQFELIMSSSREISIKLSH
jgi:hypothetical protein